jgi:hypothetical protein
VMPAGISGRIEKEHLSKRASRTLRQHQIHAKLALAI